MSDINHNPDLEIPNGDGQRPSGERPGPGRKDKLFQTQDEGIRRGNGSYKGIKKLFTSPFPYLFMAILLTAILLFCGNRDDTQTAPVHDEYQLAQIQDGNPQDVMQGEIQEENRQAEIPEPEIPVSALPETVIPKDEIPESEIPESGIPNGNAQTEAPGGYLQGGNQAGYPQQESLIENPQPDIPGDAPGEKVNGTDADAGDRQDRHSVPVESITITADTDVMAQCDTLQLTASISPSNADNSALLWFSDDETIARVSQEGLVTSVSAGYTVISAVSSNGIQTDFPLSVSSSRKVMTLTVSTECTQNDKVGSNWTYRYLMNGIPIHAVQNMMVEAGKTLRLESEIIEHDEQPDLGSAENNYYVEQTDLEDGFEVRQEVYVRENRPKLAGNTASFVVTYRFSDAVE